MKRNLMCGGAFGCCLLVMVQHFLHAQALPAELSELASGVGGACYQKVVDEYTCTDKFVKDQGRDKAACPETSPGSGFYKYWEATGIKPEYCAQVATGAGGKKKCDSTTPQVCVRLYTCSDANCTNCGDPGTEEKPTKATLGGYDCTGA